MGEKAVTFAGRVPRQRGVPAVDTVAWRLSEGAETLGEDRVAGW